MTPELIALNILGLCLLAAVGLLFTGGRLVWHDRNRNDRREDAARPPSPTLGHFRPLQNLTVEFFARTEPCARLLSVLSAYEHSLKIEEALRKARPADEHSEVGRDPDFGIDRAALWIMHLSGLVRLAKGEVVVTDIGREVHRRIMIPPRPPENKRRDSGYDALFVPLPVDTDARSHMRRVRGALHPRTSDFIPRSSSAAAPIKLGELRKQ